jgi:hypothetical protein
MAEINKRTALHCFKKNLYQYVSQAWKIDKKTQNSCTTVSEKYSNNVHQIFLPRYCRFE